MDETPPPSASEAECNFVSPPSEAAPQQQAEDRILDQLRLFSALLEAIPNPVFYIDADGRYIGCNQAFARLVGGDVSQIVGRTITEVWPGGDAAAYHEGNTKLLRRGGVECHEATLTNAQNQTRNVLIQKAVFEHNDGSLGGIVGVIVDITDQRRAEEERLAMHVQMQKTQRLESLGLLAGGVAHDFNNLLMIILGNTDLAIRDLPSHSPVRPMIETIKTTSLRASELTNQLLAYAGKGRTRIRPLDVNQLVREMGQLLQVSLSEQVVLQYDLAPSLPPFQGDSSQMRQIVMNLIANASEAIGEEGGTIDIRTRIENVDRETLERTFLNDHLDPGRYLELHVSDTGRGMDEETRRKIFEPFFTTKFTGRGLGLAAVLGIVRNHKGAIDVASEPGAGTQFTVFLPVTESTKAAESSSEEPWTGRGTVLLVDDEPAVRQTGATMLRRLGFEALVAADGLDAVTMFQQRPHDVDLVLLDVSIPGISGRETLARLRRLCPEVKVLLCTGHDEKDAEKHFGDDGASSGVLGFLHKPFDLDTLSACLRKTLAPS